MNSIVAKLVTLDKAHVVHSRYGFQDTGQHIRSKLVVLYEGQVFDGDMRHDHVFNGTYEVFSVVGLVAGDNLWVMGSRTTIFCVMLVFVGHGHPYVSEYDIRWTVHHSCRELS